MEKHWNVYLIIDVECSDKLIGIRCRTERLRIYLQMSKAPFKVVEKEYFSVKNTNYEDSNLNLYVGLYPDPRLKIAVIRWTDRTNKSKHKNTVCQKGHRNKSSHSKIVARQINLCALLVKGILLSIFDLREIL